MISPHVLICARDPEISREFESAAASGTNTAPVLHVADDLTHAVDYARDFSPTITIVDFDGDFDNFRTTIREILSVAPETAVAGTFHPDQVDPTVSGGLFVEGVRAGAQDFLRRPISSNDLRQLFGRTNNRKPIHHSSTGKTIAFISNKGGVGKSTLAVNTATRLAQKHPGDVLLIDASLQMGICAPMLNLEPQTSLLDAIRERQRLDSTLIRQLATPHTSGLELLAAPPDAVSATEIDEQLMTRVLNLARRTYRYVIIDTFPLFDRIIMTVLDTADLAYLVLDNVVPTVLSIKHLLDLLDELGHPTERRRIAINRMTSVTGHPSRHDIEQTLGQKVDHAFPYDKKALTSANLGEPFALNPNWWSPLEKPLNSLVEEIEEHRRQAPQADGQQNGKPVQEAGNSLFDASGEPDHV